MEIPKTSSAKRRARESAKKQREQGAGETLPPAPAAQPLIVAAQLTEESMNEDKIQKAEQGPQEPPAVVKDKVVDLIVAAKMLEFDVQEDD